MTAAKSTTAKAEAKPGGTEALPPGTAKPKGESIQQLKNRLRNEAEREVLNNHKDEVIKITAAKYAEHNLEYVRRLTDEEKAQKAIEDYLAQYPELRQKLAPALVEAAPGGALDQFRSASYDEEPAFQRDSEV
jgi:hypothetical protein